MMRSPMFGTGVNAGPSAIARALTSGPGAGALTLGGIAAGAIIGTNYVPALPANSQSDKVASAAIAGTLLLGIAGLGTLVGIGDAGSASKALKWAAAGTALTAGAVALGRGTMATYRNEEAAQKEWIAGRPQRLEENGIGRLERTADGELRGNVVAPSDTEYRSFSRDEPLFNYWSDDYAVRTQLLTQQSMASYSDQADAVRAMVEDWGDGAVVEHHGRFVHVGVGLDKDSEEEKVQLTPNADGSIDGSSTDSTKKVVAVEHNGKVYQPFEDALYPVKEWDES